MERIDYISKKVGRIGHDTDFLLNVTQRNANVFNKWSDKTDRRLKKLEGRTGLLMFLVIGLIAEDIKIRWKAYQKISDFEKTEENSEENSEN